jgi:broad specificity phosphatase PhoE
MTEIYLIRHGQASFGAADYDRLSPLGHRQAALLGVYFRRAGIGFDALFAGPLLRHAQTAQGAMAGRKDTEPIQIIAELAEIDTEAIVSARIAAMLEAEPELAQAYAHRHRDVQAFRRIVSRAMRDSIGAAAAPAGDPMTLFSERVRRGLGTVAALAAGCDRVAVFTSGGTIAVTLQAALSLAPEVAMEIGWQIYNTSVSVFEAGNGRLSLVGFNATAHLDLETDADLKTLF